MVPQDAPRSSLRGRKDERCHLAEDEILMPPTRSSIRDALHQVIDPELGVNIVDLGLVYGIWIDDDGVRIEMTMTTPACPLGEYLKDLVESSIKASHDDADNVEVVFVWDPPWTPDLLSDEGKHQLGV
jgi:metal-sulfur cluster biosynthetic enzyme